MDRTENALKEATDTKQLILGTGTLSEIGKMFRYLFPDKRAIIIADTNTYRVAGDATYNSLKNEGVLQDNPFIFDDPALYAEWKYLTELEDRLKITDAIPVAVGSGVINDLTKLAAHRCDRRYICVGTAASMDGYTAYGSSITYQGSKQAFDCPAPYGMLIDTGIAAAAPAELSAAGYADLIAKIPGGADWILADAVGAEPIVKEIFDIVQADLKTALKDPKGVCEGKPEAIEPLSKGLLLSGFAMQAHHSSRPASGTEHQFSHLWDMEHLTFEGQTVSHGFKVGIGTLVTSAFYEFLLETPVAQLDVDACVDAWEDWETTENKIRTIFNHQEEFVARCLTETKAKYVDRAELRKELEAFKNNWPDSSAQLRNQLIPFQEVRRCLQEVGAPYEPEQIGISRAKLRETCIKVQYMRSRFAIIDLAWRARYLDQWLDRLFGTGGIWEIK